MANDADLVTGNIKSGVNIFGVDGKSSVVDTANTTAAKSNILMGKTAYVNGSLVTGDVPLGADITGGGGVKAIPIPDGLYSGSKTATANDDDLQAGYIKYYKIIFGVTGNLAGGVSSTCPGGTVGSPPRWCKNNKVISNKEYTALIIVSASWVYFVGANLVFAPTIA